MAEDYCEHCDLPLSQCIHGMPAPVPPAPAPKAGTTRPRSSRPPTPRAAVAPASRPPSRRTNQGEFRAHILAVLRDAGVPLETDEMMLELEIRLDEVLRERDREVSATREPRWQTAARAERKAMIDDGLIVPAQPGIWELTPYGRQLSQRPPTGT